MRTESESDWDLQVSLMPGMKVSAHQVCVCVHVRVRECVCLGCAVVNHHLCVEGGWASSHFHTLVYTHAGGGDTLGNMEKEKVGKIKKKR